MVYNLVVKYYKVGIPEEWLQFMEVIAQIIKGEDIQNGDTRDALQVFQNKEENQEIKDGPAFTKCLAAVK
eukprot:13011557-Ditylum_brightwellii.AAC.1